MPELSTACVCANAGANIVDRISPLFWLFDGPTSATLVFSVLTLFTRIRTRAHRPRIDECVLLYLCRLIDDWSRLVSSLHRHAGAQNRRRFEVVNPYTAPLASGDAQRSNGIMLVAVAVDGTEYCYRYSARSRTDDDTDSDRSKANLCVIGNGNATNDACYATSQSNI